ncbi:hypothetical protein V8E55_006991 [Tylopilus felleus]
MILVAGWTMWYVHAHPHPHRVGWVLTLRATLVLIVLVARCSGAGGMASHHGRHRVGQAAPVLVLIILIVRHSALVAQHCTASTSVVVVVTWGMQWKGSGGGSIAQRVARPIVLVLIGWRRERIVVVVVRAPLIVHHSSSHPTHSELSVQWPLYLVTLPVS